MIETLYLATKNAGKVRELQNFLQERQVRVVGAPEDFEVEETGKTFRANAERKARALAQRVGAQALADDSGICVDSLGGRPGIYSARLSGVLGDGQDRANRDTLLALMKGHTGPKREATMVCSLVLAWPDGRIQCAEAQVRGVITEAPRGKLGFGYDAIFCSQKMNQTWAELEDAARWAQSHRRQALVLLGLGACGLTA